jgi:hypothetical protein
MVDPIMKEEEEKPLGVHLHLDIIGLKGISPKDHYML